MALTVDHVPFAWHDLDEITAAFERLGPTLRNDAVTTILATGPSATADMGALVKGAHGPMEVHVLLVEDR